MSFCPYCGGQLVPGASFCPGCGAQVTAVAAAAPAYPVQAAPVVNTAPADYSLVLVSLGSCRKSYADDVLEDLLGYTNAEAAQLIRAVPTQIAQYLTAEQATYLAQALTEYGMQVVVYCGQNVVDVGQYATHSVFNTDGSFVTTALTALAGLTVANRLTRFVRWDRPSLLERIFAPRYTVVEPPRHIRRTVRRAPEPAPRRDPAPRVAPRAGGISGSRGLGGSRGGGGSRGPFGGGRPSGRGHSGGIGGSRGPGGRGPGGRR